MNCCGGFCFVVTSSYIFDKTVIAGDNCPLVILIKCNLLLCEALDASIVCMLWQLPHYF